MGIALTCTWRPRGEGEHWRALHPQLMRLYDQISIVVPTDADLDQARALWDTLGIEVAVASAPSRQRYEALRRAVDSGADFIHCCDGDRLLHWGETRFDELREAVVAIQQHDCLLLGRSAYALETHPRTLRETETIINAVGSYLLGQPVELGGGSRGFSRAAAQLILQQAVPESYGDAEWPVVVRRCGLPISVRLVDGLEWETPDHVQPGTSDPERRRQLAEARDGDPKRWSDRIRLAQRIIEEALAAAERPLLA